MKILTSPPLPAGTTEVAYAITLAPSGGTPPYTWRLAPGSPPLPDGLELTPSTGKIAGTPTAIGTSLTEFTVQDSTGQSVEKVLSMTINVAPTPLAILSNALPSGSINQIYAFALSPTDGTSPYTWGLKAGSPLPSGLILSNNGIISGTPTVTSTATHTFTLTDATSLTVEKALQLSIRAIPLSITTTALPQGTANQRYSETLEATGGTGAYTWRNSPALPTGMTLNSSTGEISGVPTGPSNTNYTFTVADRTPPTSQTATKTLPLVIGGAPPNLIITTLSPLPPGMVTQPYPITTLTSSGGTGAKTWDLASGSLPVGLSLSSSGVISGTPATTGTSSPNFRVRDLGNPQQMDTKHLSITIGLPTPPNITTASLPAGAFDVDYNQTISVTGGIRPFVWGVISGSLPEGLDLNASNGNIFGTPTHAGSFLFRLRVTDQTSQSDEQNFTIVINSPAPPSITSPSSLPAGTVNQPYPNIQFTATGGATPYEWSASPALPNGLTLNPSSGVISGTPLSGSNGNSSHEFTVTDSTIPINQQGKKSLSLTIIANVTPLTITTASLPNGTVGQFYNAVELRASGGTPPYNWVRDGSSLPEGLGLSASGAITGTPTTAGTTSTTFRVQDSTVPDQQSTTRTLMITISSTPSPLTITTRSLPDGRRNLPYVGTLEALGGAIPYTWSVNPALPDELTLAPATGVISGTPTTTSNMRHDFTIRDSANQTNTRELRLRIRNTSDDDDD